MNQQLSANTTLSHYRIVEKLGAGGMGEVWLAEDTRLKRKVALKLLPAELTADAERVRRFEQEAQAASALNHPNIITVYDIGECEAGRFIVMELVGGRTLRAVIAEDNSIETLLTLGAQMAKALSAAHAAGITHRDIKPDNIMVRDDGYVKVLDFGLARLRPATESDAEAATLAQQTTPGTVMGTVAYMSPEQARGETVSHPSDIFALGIVLYELATGRHPFQAETLVGYLHAITLQTPAPPQQWQPTLPAALNDLLLRMLDKEASQRPTAGEVAQALHEIERQRERGTERQSESATLMLSSHPVPLVPSTPIRHTVGREPERHELHAAFNATRGSLVCVAGEPGIGKTTLVEDFLTELTTRNQCTIARGRCSERLAGTEAYLPLLEALESLLQSDKRLAQTMKQLAPTWYAQVVPLSGDSEESVRLLAEVKAASQERMKRELAAFLQAVAQAQPLVIFFDDLHWADVSTIDLLSFLAGKFDALRVLIVVTYRPSDMLLAKHPFLQIKPDLQARGVCRELLLEFLTEAEIAEYLALEFPGHRFPPEFPQLIHAKTEGSPLFMADLVRYLRDRSVIANTNGAWKLEQTLPDIERELPESVRGMIERKIAQLGEDDRKLLTCASVQGYEFDSAVVAQALNLEADEAEERLEKLERVFAFVKLTSEAEFPNGTLTLKYRFVHVLYQNALYAALRATRKASLSAAVAQSLLGFYGDQPRTVAADLACLYEAARDFERAIDYFLLASRNAAGVFAGEEAVALSRRGLNLLKRLPDTPARAQQEIKLHLNLGAVFGFLKGWAFPEAGESFLRVREISQQLRNLKYLFWATYGLWGYHIIGAEPHAARQMGEQMLNIAQGESDPFLLVGAHGAVGVALQALGEIDRAHEHFQQAINLYDPRQHASYKSLYGLDPGVFSRNFDSRALWLSGYIDQARKMLQDALMLARNSSNPRSQANALFHFAFFHLLCRETGEAQKMAEACLNHCNEHGIANERDWAGVILAWILINEGKLEEGRSQMNIRMASLRAVRAEYDFTYHLALPIEPLSIFARFDEGFAAVAEAFEVLDRTGEYVWAAELYRLKGDLIMKAALTNSLNEAENCYLKAIEIAGQQKAKSLELRVAISLARLWQRQGKIAEARQMLAEIYGWFTEGFDTADLQDAKALLAELHQETISIEGNMSGDLV